MIALNNNNQLVTLASGQRMWIGTSAAHDAAVLAGTMPNNCTVAIIDEATQSYFYDDLSAELKTGIKQFDSTATAAQTWSDSYTIPSDGLYILNLFQNHQTCGVASFKSILSINGKQLITNESSNTWQSSTNGIAVPLKAGVVVSLSVSRDATAFTGDRLGYVNWWIKQMQ